MIFVIIITTKKIITNEHEIENQKTLELNIFDFNLIDFPTGIYNRTYIHTYFDSKDFNQDYKYTLEIYMNLNINQHIATPYDIIKFRLEESIFYF